MNRTLTRLEQAIKAAAPLVTSIRCGRRGEPATVSVDPPEQQANAQAAINAFDWSDAAEQTWQDAQRPERKALRDAAAQAIQDIDTYLAIANPNATQIAAQIRRLSQYMRAMIRRLVQID